MEKNPKSKGIPLKSKKKYINIYIYIFIYIYIYAYDICIYVHNIFLLSDGEISNFVEASAGPCLSVDLLGTNKTSFCQN